MFYRILILLNSDMQSKSWDIDEVNSVDFSKLEIGSINASVAQSIGITDATDFFQVIRIPWSSPYPNQILLTLSGKQRMYYRACSNGTWETPKRLITNADLEVNNITSGFITGASSITAKIARFGPLFLLDINVNLPAMSEANDNTVILTLAEGYRPRYTVELSLSSSLPQANGKLLRAFLNPNGTLSIWHTEATPQQFTFIHGTWIK